jgi:phage terminase small subunit
LSAEAKIEWRRVARALHRLGLLTSVDRAALAAYCQAYARWRQAEKALGEMAARDPLTAGMRAGDDGAGEHRARIARHRVGGRDRWDPVRPDGQATSVLDWRDRLLCSQGSEILPPPG